METIRKSNNLVKRSLIEHVTQGHRGLQVLDVGCGCGGDLLKWKAAGARVDMCDPDSDSLDEARRRAEGLKYKVRFIHGDVRDCPQKQYDIICFNFSLHYIFQDRDTFIQSIKAIRKRLRKGGVLIGCIPDARSILDALPFQDTLGNTFQSKGRVGFGDFGEQVEVCLTDTPFYSQGGRLEPLAYPDALTAHLEHKGILLEHWERFEGESLQQLYSKFLYRLY
jgi:SAM-dependent methyltransferase